jgi:hypothetical protein
MKHLILILLVLAAWRVQVRAAGFYDISDPVMAEYEGFWTGANGSKGRVTAQIRPLSNNKYDGFILLFRSRSPIAALTFEPAVFENNTIRFNAKSTAKQFGDLLPNFEASCSITNGKLAASFKGELGEGTIEASKSTRKSPTLGAKPPAGAIVLFDGQPGNAWEGFSWPVKDNFAQVGKGNVKTSQKIRGDYRLHLEFRTPYMPAEQGQARGNSGVYLQGKYELQVLDSFGLYPLQDNDCAGIYKVQAPLMNACLPPMEWQTYDITYRTDGPRLTVLHNGINVLNDVKIPGSLVDQGTGGADPSAGFLLLQDHGNPVQYRNIWAELLKE